MTVAELVAEVRGARSLYLYALPAYALAILAEIVVSRRREDRRYRLHDALTDLGVSLGNTVFGVLWTPLCFGINTLAYRISPLRIPSTWWSVVALFVLADLCYYAAHRTGHSVRLFWATHQAHHSATHLNLLVGLRNPWTSGFHDWIFWLPLPILGFDPLSIARVQAAGLIYQFFLHTQAIGSLGPLGMVLNTPSHHRVHHGTNPEYLDRNLGGVLIVWDRLFGTFAPERAAPVYGSVTPEPSSNPAVIALVGWRRLLREMASAPTLLRALKVPFGPALSAGEPATVVSVRPAGTPPPRRRAPPRARRAPRGWCRGRARPAPCRARRGAP